MSSLLFTRDTFHSSHQLLSAACRDASVRLGHRHAISLPMMIRHLISPHYATFRHFFITSFLSLFFRQVFISAAFISRLSIDTLPLILFSPLLSMPLTAFAEPAIFSQPLLIFQLFLLIFSEFRHCLSISLLLIFVFFLISFHYATVFSFFIFI